MNIHAAAVYLKIGYRMRRASWHEDSYVKTDCLGMPEFYQRREYWSIGGGESTHHTYIGGGMNEMTVDDMLAEDWELITTGIRKHYNKHGHMEYEGDTDWDNYVASKSSWDGDD
jgi:hypothetical protein